MKMNKTILTSLLISLLLLNKNTNAQQGFSVSLKAIPQFSFLQNSNDRDNNSLDKKATFNANFGVGANYGFTNKLGVGMDVVYSLQGQRYNMNGFETNQKIDYVKVPLYFTYTHNPSKPISFVEKIGPQISFLTDSKLTDDNGHTLKSDTKDLYKDVTFGGMAATGVQFKLNSKLYLTTIARFD